MLLSAVQVRWAVERDVALSVHPPTACAMRRGPFGVADGALI
jgi:hypothetical protein